MEMATPGGFTQAQDKLPWGTGEQHRADDFRGQAGERLIGTLGDFAVEGGFTQVLAPTHLIESVDDGWLDFDTQSVRQLKAHLDRETRGAVSIVYPLVLPPVSCATARSDARSLTHCSGRRRCGLAAGWRHQCQRNCRGSEYIAAAATHALGILLCDRSAAIRPLIACLWCGRWDFAGIAMVNADHGDIAGPATVPFTPSRKVYVRRWI